MNHRMTEKDQYFLYLNLGAQIKMFREKANLSQLELGNLIQLSRASIVNIEKGRQNPSIHLLVDLSRVFQINVTEFFQGDFWETQSQEMKNTRIETEINKVSTSDGRLKVNEFIKQVKS